MKGISRRKFIAFAMSAVAVAVAGTALALLGADLYVHRKFEQAAGMNIWGYRGPTLGPKQPNEIRMAVLGGSTALGYGLTQEDSFPSQLAVALNRGAAGRDHHFVAANLGYNNSGAYAFLSTLQDYKYLGYDIVCLYEGYNDLSTAANMRVSRRDSGIFRLTGYYPLLPTVAYEKAMQLRYGNLNDAYRRKSVVFRPNMADRTKASALETSMAILNAVERHKESGDLDGLEMPEAQSEGCGKRWGFYCHSVALAVAEARRMNKPVMVVTQPYNGPLHRDQQRALQGMMARRWPADPMVKYVDLGNAVDVSDLSLCWDGMHLSQAGNRRIADGLVQPVLGALRLASE